MSTEPIGSLIITDGKGKVTTMQPTQNNMVLTVDNTISKKLKFELIENLINVSNLKIEYQKQVALPSSKLYSNNYEKLSAFSLLGTNTITLNKISLISYLNSNGISYDVRLYDITNNLVIAEVNLTNKVSQKIFINFTSRLLSPNDAIVEIQFRFNGTTQNKYIYTDEFILYYNLK